MQGSSTKQTAETLNCSRANIRYHLEQLCIRGLLDEDKKHISNSKINSVGLQIIRGGKRRVVSHKKKVDLKGCPPSKRQPNTQKLTPRERLVYSMIVNEGKRQYVVANTLKTTKQNISKIYNKAKNKVEIRRGNKKEVDSSVSSQPLSPPLSPLRYRSHNWRWSIKILKKLDNFKGVMSDSIDKNTIKIWENSIDIYSNLDFFSDDKEQCFIDGLQYWCAFFDKLEKDYGCILNIPGINNKKLVKCELAQTNNEIAPVGIEILSG